MKTEQVWMAYTLLLLLLLMMMMIVIQLILRKFKHNSQVILI